MTKKKKASAIKYEKNYSVPLVTASGYGYVAEKIINAGKENNIPIISNPELAESLSHIPIGEDIPSELYDVIACVLAYIYGLK